MSSLRVTKKRKDKKGKVRSSNKFDEESDLKDFDEDGAFIDYADKNSDDESESDESADEETADAKRLRVAKAFLDKVRSSTAEGLEDEEEEEDLLGARDSLVADRLLQQQQEETGRVLRLICKRFVRSDDQSLGSAVGRRHKNSVTAVALTLDDTEGFSASKDGAIVNWNIETNNSVLYEWPANEPSTSGRTGKINKKGFKGGGKPSRHVLALDVSSDGRYLAAGGLDQKIHVWDTRTRQHVQAFKGHRGAISGLAFRQGTHQLFSASYDRSIKIWSVDDLAYMDSLYGHQSDIVALDCLRQERVLSAGRDRTCRIWKVPEETQLVLRGHSASIDCCAMITANDFISGSEDGSVALWSSVRKKPVHVMRGAHGPVPGKQGTAAVEAEEGEEDKEGNAEEVPGAEWVPNGHLEEAVPSANGISSSSIYGVGGAIEAWVGAVAVCRNSDMAASGAGDGFVRLWQCDTSKRRLRSLHKFPTAGFVNSLAIATSGRFLLAGTGQEPRLGRWGRIKEARNGVLMHSIPLSE